MQTFFYIVSPTITFLAVLIAFLALLKQSRPRILVHYRPNKGIQSIIDLVVENIGSGTACGVRFSQPIPARCYGIEKPDGQGVEVLSDGVPLLASGQVLVFDGGQFGGLDARVGSGLEIVASYTYRTPFGFERERADTNILSVKYMKYMSTRTSGEQALVDAMKGTNNTVFIRMLKQLECIADSLEEKGTLNRQEGK